MTNHPRPRPDRPDVVFVASQVQPRLGMEAALAQVVRELERQGRRVTVVSLSGRHDMHWPSALTSLDLGHGGRRSLRASHALRTYVRAEPEAVWAGVGIWAYLPLLAATARTGVRVVAWEHSMLPWRLENDTGVRRQAAVARRLLHRASDVVAVSPSVAATVSELAPRADVRVIPNAVSFDVTRAARTPRAAEAPVRLLGLGSLRPVKNFELAVAALAHLPTGHRLRIAGDGPARSDLLRLADDLGVADRVELLGHVADPLALLAESDVLVHPAWSETFGYSLLEAAAADVPVVVRDAPTMNEVVPTHAPGLCVADPTAQSLAAAITDALGSSAPGAAAFDAARARVAADFSPARVGALWADLLA